MSEHFINLNCANCGAKLDVYDDMERFSGGYCGTELIVQRRGGTVALKLVTEAIKKVQIGTDRTAAELALVRLEKESSELKTKIAVVERRASGDGCGAIGCLMIILIFFEYFFIKEGATGFAVGLLVMLAVALPVAHRYGGKNKRQAKQELADLTTELEKLNQEAALHRKLLESKHSS